MQETQVQSLGWDDALEEDMGTHSSLLAREIPCTEEPGRLLSRGLQKSQVWLKQQNNNEINAEPSLTVGIRLSELTMSKHCGQCPAVRAQ